MSRTRRPVARTAQAVLATGAFVLAAAGCASSVGHNGHSDAAHSHAAIPNVFAPPTDPPALGSKLRTELPTAAQLPAGWTYRGAVIKEDDSGSELQPPRPPNIPLGLPQMNCKTAGNFALLVDYMADDAHTTANVNMGVNTSYASIYVAGYYPGYSIRQFSLIESFAAHLCKPFTLRDIYTGALVKMRTAVTPVSGLGDQALVIDESQSNGPLPDGTYYPGDYFLIVRVGNYIVDVDAPEIPIDPQSRQTRQVANTLVSKIRKLSRS